MIRANATVRGSRVPLLMAGLMLALATTVPAQRTLAQDTAASLRFIPADAIAAVIAYPREVAALPDMELLPKEVISAAGMKELGFDPLEIESLVAFAEAPGPGGPPGFGAVIKLAKPYDRQSLLPQLLAATEPGTINGRPFQKATQPFLPSVMLPNDKTIVIAPEATLSKMLAAQASDSPLLKRLKAVPAKHHVTAVVVLDSIRPMVTGQLDQVPVPPPFERFKKLPDLVSAVEAHADLSSSGQIQVVLHSTGGPSAAQLETLIQDALEMGKQAALAQTARSASSPDPIEQASAKYAERLANYFVTMLKPKREGDRVSLAVKNQGCVATMGVSAALLLPAVQAAREAARRTQASNNLKQIGLAMHNYHDTYRKFPARASMSPDGKPLLSWRVHILPFVEEAALYNEFHLDEPWDSPHNKKLIARMPKVYQAPGAPAQEFRTNYLVPNGKGTLFGGKEGPGMAAIIDGTSNTIMAVEASNAKAVIWTKPDDLDYDPQKPLDGLVGLRPGGFQALLADGAVRFISQNIDLNTLRALFTMSGGEPINNY